MSGANSKNIVFLEIVLDVTKLSNFTTKKKQ